MEVELAKLQVAAQIARAEAEIARLEAECKGLQNLLRTIQSQFQAWLTHAPRLTSSGASTKNCPNPDCQLDACLQESPAPSCTKGTSNSTKPENTASLSPPAVPSKSDRGQPKFRINKEALSANPPRFELASYQRLYDHISQNPGGKAQTDVEKNANWESPPPEQVHSGLPPRPATRLSRPPLQIKQHGSPGVIEQPPQRTSPEGQDTE